MALKNIDVWEKLLDDTPDSYKKWFKEEKEYLRKNITKNSKVLEVGCGEGRSIKDVLERTSNVTGIDHDKKAVSDAKSNLKNYPNVNILKADAKDLPFENSSFDYVICMTTFANFDKQKVKALIEMKRVVKDKGNIIISVFSEDAFKERMKMYKKFNMPIKQIINNKVIFTEELENVVSEQFSKEELLELFNKTGLKVVEIIKLDIAYICKLKK